MTKPFCINILFADTGGGHRAASEALAEGFRHRYGGEVEPVFFDGLRPYAPFPVSHLGDMSPLISGSSTTWGKSWPALNDPYIARRFMK